MKLNYKINEELTIKEFIYKNISRNFYGYLKNIYARFYINGILARAYYKLKIGDILEIEFDEVKEENGILSFKSLTILFEDDNFIVVDKKRHLQSIPSKNNPNDSIYNRLLAYFKSTNDTVHLVNRLDKETRGLILVCKNRLARALLTDFDKIYLAKTKTKLPVNNGEINLPIAKAKEGIKRIIDYDNGQNALTLYQLIEESDGIYTYKIKLKTGRTHQIRVHFSALGSPLIGDTLYNQDVDTNELGLICSEIIFLNPFTNEMINVKIKD